MRKETTYYAFDDTEFDTEEACLEYEQNLRLDLSSVLLLNEKFEVIKLKNLSDLNALDKAISEIFYIKILNVEIAERFFNWIILTVGMNMDGFPEEFADGMWLAYDDDNGVWFDPVACMKHYANIVDKLNGVSGCR